MHDTVGGRARRAAGDERGVALPLALVMLLMLTGLMLAFGVMAGTEPTIATNHQHVVQARALADSGIQRAAWALSNPDTGGGIATADTNPNAPYDGSTMLALGPGGFSVQVTHDPLLQPLTERTVTAVGWLPDEDAGHLNPHRKVRVTLQQGIVRPLDPPCALCVAGNIQVGGNATVDARSNGCGGGTPPSAGALYTGTPYPEGPRPVSGSGAIYGHGDDAANGADDIQGGAPSAAPFTYTAAELAKFKQIARDRGTYYQGAVTSIPSAGIVYIDTTTGADFSATTPDAEAGTLSLSGNGEFDGVIIVAGSITLTGTRVFNGLIYALNDLTVSAGNVTINGAIVSENRKDVSSTNIDTGATGSTLINYNCGYVRNGGRSPNQQLSTLWTVKDGTYLETSGH